MTAPRRSAFDHSLFIRVGIDLLEWIEAEMEAESIRSPGRAITRSDVVRTILERARLAPVKKAAR